MSQTEVDLRTRQPRDEPRRGGRRRSAVPGAPAAVALLTALALLAVPSDLRAQHDHTHGEDGGHQHAGLHFSHPMVAESVTPDTKIRLDHQYFDFPAGREHSGVLEAEYAFSPSFSLEAALPYSYSATAVGNAGVLLKFANRAFQDAGVMLGYGVGVTFPTNGSPADTSAGHDHGDHQHDVAASGGGFPAPVRFHTGGTGIEGTLGSDEWRVGPFLNVGWKTGALELVSWGTFGIPFHQHEQAEVATELDWNLSALVHASDQLQPMLELDGSGGISGPAVGRDVVHLSPGLKIRPFGGEPLWIGTSVGFPLASGMEEDPFDVRWKTSLFWHFF